MAQSAVRLGRQTNLVLLFAFSFLLWNLLKCIKFAFRLCNKCLTKKNCPIKVWKCQAMHEVFSVTPPVWFGRTGCGCTAALSVAMATSRQRGPKALSLASQTAVTLRIDSIHMSMEAEQKWVSPHVEEELKSRLTSLTLPGGGGVKTNTLMDRYRPRLSLYREVWSAAQSSKVIVTFSYQIYQQR